MRLSIPTRVLNFSQNEQDIIEAALDLYKHFLYNHDRKQFGMFSESANGMSYDEKNKLFNENFRKQVVKKAYLPETAINDKKIFQMSNVRSMSFALVAEILDTMLPQTMIESFRSIAQIDVIGFGNTKTYSVPNTAIFNVNKVSRGTRKTEPQRFYNGDAILIPEPRMITIEENFEEILMGKCDWGQLIMRAAVSFEQEITTDIYTTIAGEYSGLDTNFNEAGYSQTAFIKLAQRISACNRSNVTVMGTKAALGSILPTNDHLKQAVGDEYNRYGYIRNFMGVDLMEVPQTITPNTTDFAIADDELYFFSLGTDRPVKIAMEDGGMMFESMEAGAFADNSYYQSIVKGWDLDVITSSKYGIMKIA
jgi:hypothetical protein